MWMRWGWQKAMACVLVAICAGFAVWTTQFRAKAAQQNEAELGEDVWKLETFEIPKTDQPEELFEFLQQSLSEEKEFSSEDEQREHQFRAMLTMIAVGERILGLAEAADDTLEKGAQLKLQGHINMAMLGAAKGTEKALQLVRDLAKDERPVVVQFAQNNEQLVRIICVGGLSPEARGELVQEVLADVEKRKLAQRVLKKAQMLGETLSEAGDAELMTVLYTRLAELMRESGNENLADQAVRLEGQIRRMNLPGQFIDLEATTLTGEKFDWSAYRGKVVLIDFWATWCGPCRAELPNVKKNYQKYQARGFDVVGVSLDSDRSELEEFLKNEKIPWVTLFEPEEKYRGWENPLAIRYGVTGIPLAILVDKEGKVISLMARGPKLSQLLEEQFGSN